MRTLDQIDYPKTADEWWLIIEANKDDLLNLILGFHPYYNNSNEEFEITAPAAEKMSKEIRERIKENTPNDPEVLFNTYLKYKDPQMSTLLNDTWFGMPESKGIRRLPGFMVLCDLCSECDVLFN